SIRERQFPGLTPSDIEQFRRWCRQTRDTLRTVARQAGAVVVTGSSSVEWKPLVIPQRVERYNSAFLFEPAPEAPVQRYDKIHLVLFGEFVPFRFGRLHTVYRWLNALTPWGANGMEYSLSSGTTFRPFEFGARSNPQRRFRAAAPICYEDTEPYVA